MNTKQHIFFAFNQLLSYAIPDVPRWIIVEMSKLEFRRRNALRVNRIHFD